MNLEAIASFDQGNNRYYDYSAHMSQMYSDRPAIVAIILDNNFKKFQKILVSKI